MKKFLMIVGGVVVGMFVLTFVFTEVTSLFSKKMVCKSDNVKLTIMYNDKSLTEYKFFTTANLDYNYEKQQKYAEQIGVEEYLNQFSAWFSENTNGSCTRK